MRRFELTDEQFARIEQMLPGKTSDPGRSADNRVFLAAVLWILRTGAPWRDLPERFGPWNSVFQRFRRWAKKGRWTAIFEAVQEPDWEWMMIDASVIRAHQHAAGASKKSNPARRGCTVARRADSRSHRRGTDSGSLRTHPDPPGSSRTHAANSGIRNTTENAGKEASSRSVGTLGRRPQHQNPHGLRRARLAGPVPSERWRSARQQDGRIADRGSHCGTLPRGQRVRQQESGRGRRGRGHNGIDSVAEQQPGTANVRYRHLQRTESDRTSVQSAQELSTRYEKSARNFLAMLPLAGTMLWLA